MNPTHIRLIRKTVRDLLKAALAAETAGFHPPAEANLIRLEYRHARQRYDSMLRTFVLECGPEFTGEEE